MARLHDTYPKDEETTTAPSSSHSKKAAIVLNGIKLTTDIRAEVQYRLGKKEVECFYTKPCNVIRGTNRGGLGWLSKQSHSVAWTALDAALKSKPDMFQL
jgi:hypothetical protein